MPIFDELALAYDQSINWEQRLQRELPFFRKFIKDQQKMRILDLACGSGRHAIALAKEGHEVIGLDISPAMIAAATHHAEKNNVKVQFHTADMQNVKTTVKGSFDLIMCLGNSLALLPSHAALKTTLQEVKSLLSKDGYFISQTLNFEEIRATNFRFFPLKSGVSAAGNEVIFARFFQPHSNDLSSTLVFTAFVKTDSGWKTITREQSVLQLTQILLNKILRAVGFTHLESYADYQQTQFSRPNSRNLILLTQK
ncbi:MAG: class I SAM-dependent methyltransferase [Promethearchaeota archaeon]